MNIMTTITPYIEINGLILTPGGSDPTGLHVTHSGCVTPSGGGLKIDEYNYPNRNYATAIHGGRQLRKWKVEVASFTRSDIDEFLDYVNNAPIDSEFYPESSDRCCYIYMAHAESTKPQRASHPVTGAWTWRYMAQAEIVVRGTWTYGVDQGLGLTADVALWHSETGLENGGAIPAGLDYLLISGDYDSDSGEYIDNVWVRTWVNDVYIEDQGYLLLCERLMRNDVFELNRWGEVNHSYETDFPMTYADLQIDLQGSAYMNYGAAGSIAHEALHLGTNAKIIMPFWGPLPLGANPYIEVWVSEMVGTPIIQAAAESDLSDLAGWSGTLQLGYNKIYIPYAVGRTDIFFGVTTDGSSQITISSIKGFVKRYVAPSSVCLVDPGENINFTIGADCDGCLNAKLLEICYRDIFYY
jgi:hypothetical protein